MEGGEDPFARKTPLCDQPVSAGISPLIIASVASFYAFSFENS
jgi:hypothetical protein